VDSEEVILGGKILAYKFGKRDHQMHLPSAEYLGKVLEKIKSPGIYDVLIEVHTGTEKKVLSVSNIPVDSADRPYKSYGFKLEENLFYDRYSGMRQSNCVTRYPRDHGVRGPSQPHPGALQEHGRPRVQAGHS
jgi:hypothetical protein